MIATLSGTIAEKLSDIVILEVQGVGYALFVTTEDNGQLVIGQTAKVYVYEHLREQLHDLYGFVHHDTQLLFELLLAVNGVGPKMALNVLSIGNIEDVRNAIAGGDMRFIQQASGVGRRVAERIIIELKDKVGLSSVDLSHSGLLQSESLLMKDEAVEALVKLGYTPTDAAAALRPIDSELSTEVRVRQALQGKT